MLGLVCRGRKEHGEHGMSAALLPGCCLSTAAAAGAYIGIK